MAVKTMTMSTGAGLYNEGWHEVTIRQATQGVWKGPKGESQYVDLLFEDYADNMNLRVYEVRNNETNEEFKIANLFRHAMAGIIEVLNDPTGKKPILQYDDNVENLVGTRINAFIFKNREGYSEFFDTVAPVEQEGEHYSFSADKVIALKNAAEKNFFRSNKSSHLTNGTALKGTPVTNTSSNEEIPF
jgi:hypothetical protein|tara:strand:- start:96 stop:659 length:564 start_codon:yes stop_codon:yes gene_type:complete